MGKLDRMMTALSEKYWCPENDQSTLSKEVLPLIALKQPYYNQNHRCHRIVRPHLGFPYRILRVTIGKRCQYIPLIGPPLLPNPFFTSSLGFPWSPPWISTKAERRTGWEEFSREK